MSEKINVIGPPPYQAWRVNFCDQLDDYNVVFTAVIDAKSYNAARQIVHEQYRTLENAFATFVYREDRPPSEWEKPLP
jgi:hypothetical protein